MTRDEKSYRYQSRGIKGDEEYLNGMVSALYKRDDIDVSLYTNFYYEISDKEIPYKCHRYFFKNSEKMVPSAKRNAVRATEYICQYLKLVNIIKREKPDRLFLKRKMQI